MQQQCWRMLFAEIHKRREVRTGVPWQAILLADRSVQRIGQHLHQLACRPSLQMHRRMGPQKTPWNMDDLVPPEQCFPSFATIAYVIEASEWAR